MWKLSSYTEFMLAKLCSPWSSVSSTWLLASLCTILFFAHCWKCDIPIHSLPLHFLPSMSHAFCLVYWCNGKPLAVWPCLDSCVLDDLSDTEPFCISRVKPNHSKFILVSFAFLVSWLRKLECLRHVLKNRGFLPSVQKRWYMFFTLSLTTYSLILLGRSFFNIKKKYGPKF